MPTYRQASFIRRALSSLRAQTFEGWELVIIDDGSDDETRRILEPYLADPRVRYERLDRNQGLGHALNVATGLARGQYIAYLPSDDVYFAGHLGRLVTFLDEHPEVYLAYGGLRWSERPLSVDGVGRGLYWKLDREGATLQGDAPIGAEAELLAKENNVLAMVQVMHRRTLEAHVRWATRAEIVSDTLEPDFWRALLAAGAKLAYAGDVTAEWSTHAENRHNLILHPISGGLSRYREHYGIQQGETLNWQPTLGFPVDERACYERVRHTLQLPAQGGLKILLVGSLGFNAERIVALEEQGHQLHGLWSQGEMWDNFGTFPFANIQHIPADSRWAERVRELQPDIIYALLNWQALPLIDMVIAEGLGIPIAFHFKESPHFCFQRGLWPTLLRILSKSDGQIFISEESLEWFQLATDHLLKPERVLILDGDLPKRDWMTEEWSPKLSEADGQLHTVCVGRPIGLNPEEDARSAQFVESLLRAGIHVHLYGNSKLFHNVAPEVIERVTALGLVHFHPPVGPGDWVRELSRYDAAWSHIFEARNRGDLRRASWNELNLPARLGTYLAAGLPLLLKDNSGSRVAVDSLAARHGVGVFFREIDDLVAQLRDREGMRARTERARAARHQLAFDTHVPALVAFFRRLIEGA